MGKKDANTPDMSGAITAMSQMNAAAMMHDSDNQYNMGMAQIGSQIMQAQSMFQLGTMQINASLQQGREQLQNSLRIAELDYQARVDKQQDTHEEKLAEIDLRKHEIDVEAQTAAQTNSQMDTSSWS